MFETLIGQTIVRIDGAHADSELIKFETEDGSIYHQKHYQDCCEHVRVVEVIGDIDDVIGHPILLAEEVSSDAASAELSYDENGTWTFYKLSTIKGNVTIRWLGESNGYYSEDVDFYKVFPR